MHLRHRRAQTSLFCWLSLRCNGIFPTNGLNRLTLRPASDIARDPKIIQDEEQRGPRIQVKEIAKLHDRIPLNTKDIFVDDLAATVEAHRATNRAKIIRKIDLGPPQYQNKDWKHLRDFHDGRQLPIDVSQGKEAPTDPPPSPVIPRKAPRKPKNSGIKNRVKVEEFDLGGIKARRIILGGFHARRADSKSGKGKDDFSDESVFSTQRTEKVSPDSSQSDPVTNQPWMNYLDSSPEDHLGLLSSEIRGLERYTRLTSVEEEASKQVLSDVRSAIVGRFARKRLEVVGLRNAGLAIPTSDFNFCISLEKIKNIERYRQVEYETLRRFENILTKTRQFTYVRTIHAETSVVRAQHWATGARVEFQASSRPDKTNEQVDLWTQELPSLRALFVALRICLEANQLGTVKQGGISPYTLIVMISTAFTHARHESDHDLGGQLLHVLKFWGMADLSRFPYSAIAPQLYERKNLASTDDWSSSTTESSDDIQLQRQGVDHLGQKVDDVPSKLYPQEPTDNFKDLGPDFVPINNVQRLFNTAYERLRNETAVDREEETQNLTSSTSGPQRSVLQRLIQTDFTAFELARSRLQHHADPDSSLPDRFNRDGSLGREQQARVVEYHKRR